MLQPLLFQARKDVMLPSEFPFIGYGCKTAWMQKHLPGAGAGAGARYTGAGAWYTRIMNSDC